MIALPGVGRALLAVEARLAGIQALLANRGDEPPSFEWESTEAYEPLTGVAAIDKALAFNNPVGPLKQHLTRRERYEGRDAVIADMTALVEGTPAGSWAHDGGTEWLRRYKAGASIEEL